MCCWSWYIQHKKLEQENKLISLWDEFFDMVEHEKAREITITQHGKSDIKPLRGRKSTFKGEDE